MTNIKSTIFTRVVEMMSDIKPEELKATVLSFSMIFILMASYFVLRPVRDAMASDWSDSEVSALWNLQFFISAGIVSLYGLLVSKITFKHVVPTVYSIFSASFIGFYFVTPLFAEPIIIEKMFYVWVSAFSLFHLSVFWSLMATIFNKEQGKRLFAIIAAGGSAGAIIGPAIPAFFAQHLGLESLMLIAAVGLFMVIPIVLVLTRSCEQVHFFSTSPDKSNRHEQRIGGKWWSGFASLMANKYLLSIAAFILLYVFVGSFIYFVQKNLLAEFSRNERASILGSIDLVVNILTFFIAFFVTSRVVKKLGMPTALALLPLILVCGLLILAITPLIVVLLSLQVCRRVGNYSVTRPAREMLFTQVNHEDRFKAKPVVDIVVYRGGDAVSGTLFALLTEGLGVGLMAVMFIGSSIAAVWAGLGIIIGRNYERSYPNKHVKEPLANTLEPQKF